MVVYTLRVGEKGKSGRTRPPAPIVGNMIDLLVSSPLLTLIVTMALGTLVGAIPFGPLKFGPAGALFVGLAIGALDPRLGSDLDLVESLGLALFVYTIGIASGASFFRQLRAQGSLLVGGVLLLGVQAVLSIAAGYLFGFGGPMAAGMFAGSGAATPALSSASAIVPGETAPAVGFAIAYPLAVVLGMLIIPPITRSKMSGKNDPSSVSATDLLDITVEVERTMKISKIPGIASLPGKAGGDLRISYLQRGDEIRVAHPSESLHAGDRVLMVGVPAAVHEAAKLLGRESDTHLANDRTKVNFRRFIVSNPQLAGRTVADLHVPTRFDSIITRVRRGDTDMLAHAEMTLQLGDRVRVVMPHDRRKELTEFFGDSETRITEVDFLSLGLGVALGIIVGFVSLSIGGAKLALGSAAGPLVVGLVLGYMGRTGPIVWTLPTSANLTIRQFGLFMFLASVGLKSGHAFAGTAFSVTGVLVGIATLLTLGIALLALWGVGAALGLSAARTAGAVAGYVGQPVLLNHVKSFVNDERTDPGYSAMFAAGMIAKILFAQVIVLL